MVRGLVVEVGVGMGRGYRIWDVEMEMGVGITIAIVMEKKEYKLNKQTRPRLYITQNKSTTDQHRRQK